ncbi:MAG: dTDP-4-dehydrorhamnose reductase [Desulfobacterales bacterium]
MLLIIGSSGQLGWEVVRQAREEGVDAHSLDYPDIDLGDPGSIAARLSPLHFDAIVNAAAYTAVDRAESEPDLAMAVNRNGPSHLARICRERNVPLIHISTDYVFGGSKTGAYTEEDEIAPLGAYGRSKAAGEAAVRERLPAHLILRTAWLCGVHGQNFVKTMLKLGRERDALMVVADQHGCPTFASDLAGAVLQIYAGHREGRPVEWGTYHYCGSGAATWHAFAEEIFEIARGYEALRVKAIVPIPTSEYPTPARRPVNSVLDCSKIERRLGITPRPWGESLREMLGRLYRTPARD